MLGRGKALLQLLMEAGYRVSKKKAQICKEEVRYLGFVLKKDTRFQTLVGSYILMVLALQNKDNGCQVSQSGRGHQD